MASFGKTADKITHCDQRKKNDDVKHRVPFLGHPDRGAVNIQFRGALGDGRGGIAYIDDGVSAELLGLLDHAGRGLVSGFLQKLGIAFKLPADDVFQTRHDIPADMLGPNRITGNQAEMLGNGFSWNGFGIGNDHLFSFRYFYIQVTQKIQVN